MLDEMLDKMNLTQIVRYLFSGCVAVIAVLIVKGISVQDISKWLFSKVYTTATISGTALTILTISVFLAGYILFNLYRGFIYEFFILRLIKGPFGRIFRIYTYREFIRDLWAKEKGHEIGTTKSELLYAVIKTTLIKDFYKEVGSPITTGLHFLYYTTFVLLVCTLIRISHLWPYTLLFIVIFIIVLITDWHFEKIELLLFRLHEDKVVDAIKKIKD